jgi:hypothetical protein
MCPAVSSLGCCSHEKAVPNSGLTSQCRLTLIEKSVGVLEGSDPLPGSETARRNGAWDMTDKDPG